MGLAGIPVLVNGQRLLVDGGLTINDDRSRPWLATVLAWTLRPGPGAGCNGGDST